jgi:hypothetical protein
MPLEPPGLPLRTSFGPRQGVVASAHHRRGLVSHTKIPSTRMPTSQGTNSTPPTSNPRPPAPTSPVNIGPQEIARKPIVQIARISRRVVFSTPREYAPVARADWRGQPAGRQAPPRWEWAKGEPPALEQSIPECYGPDRPTQPDDGSLKAAETPRGRGWENAGPGQARETGSLAGTAWARSSFQSSGPAARVRSAQATARWRR